MSDVHILHAVDRAAADRKQAALQVLERVAEMVREDRCNGLMVIAFERPEGGPDVEMNIERYYLSGGIGDMLTLLGANKLVRDEISEGCRAKMGVG